MTATTKWVLGLVGFAICFYGWWLLPALWLIYIGFIVILVATPTKKPAVAPGAQAKQSNSVAQYSAPVQAYPATNADEIIQAIEDRMRNTEDESVREGLRQALDEVVRLSQSGDALFIDEPIFESVQPAAMSAEEQAAEKQKQELRNINTILYLASFLLVGAAALFIGLGTNLPETVKFVLVLVVAVIFYGAGLGLHRHSPKLKPAAVAFVGTGLALVPFVGLAFYSYVLTDAPLVWWLTSLIGLAAFWLALLEIKTPVVSYLTLAFVFSLATSSVSALHAPFVWYFVAIIITSSLLMYLSYKLPKWMPRSLQLPLEQNAQIVTPVALIGSLFMVESFTSFDYALISGVGALHYAVNALGYKTDKNRYVYWSAARAITLVFAMNVTYFATESWQWVATTLLVGSLLLHIGAVADIKREPLEQWWLWATQLLIGLSLFGWLENMSQIVAGLVVLGLVSAHQLYVMKRAEFGIVGVAAAALLPLVLFRGAIEPVMEFEYIALIAAALAAMMLALRVALTRFRPAYKYVATALYTTLATEAVLLSAISLDATWFGSIIVAVAALVYLAAFVERQAYVHIISNMVAVVGLYIFFGDAIDNYLWATLATAWTLGAGLYALRWYFAQSSSKDVVRSEIMLYSSIAVLVIGAIVTFMLEQTTVAAVMTGCVAMGVIAYEGYVRKQIFWYEIALYGVTVFIQRLVGYSYPDANLLMYTHWWAAVLGLAMLINLGKPKDQQLVRGIIGLALFSFPTGLFALSQGEGYQLLFLLEHIGLTIVGAMTNKKLAVQWGAIGVGLALLWLLKGYTYVLLALLAFGLIGFAIWRLLKKA